VIYFIRLTVLFLKAIYFFLQKDKSSIITTTNTKSTPTCKVLTNRCL